jgi:hypothetical protein
MNRAFAGMILLVSFSWVIISSAQDGKGLIRGVVIDDHGKPVASAKVTATTSESTENAERYATTDEKGNFSFTALPWGKYSLAPGKPEAGFPDMSLAFYNNHSPLPTIGLAPGNPTAEVKVVLQQRAAVLSGTVTDRESHEPVQATFLLRRADHPADLVTQDMPSPYRVLVPYDTDVKMQVVAPGYKPWYYPGTIGATESSTLRIKANQDKQLNIQLEREWPNS